MSHTTRDKAKLINRVRRIRGQVEAIERALEEERECDEVLQTIAACRGAINGLIAEIIEGHIRYTMGGEETVSAARKSKERQRVAAQQLIDVVRAYLK